MSGPGTVECILDAAEELASQKSFEAVSIRELTAHARVNIAAVNYHFGSKDGLREAMVGRIFQRMQKRRAELLSTLPPQPTPEDLLRAFLRPVLEVDERRHRILDQLMGRILAEPEMVASLLRRHGGEVMDRLLEAFCAALPGLPAKVLILRLHFALGSVVHHLRSARALTAVWGIKEPTPEQVLDEVVRFAAAGLRAPQEA